MKRRKKPNHRTVTRTCDFVMETAPQQCNRLKVQRKRVATIHTKIERIRDYYHKKNASIISNVYRYAALEEHGVQFMIRNRKLAKVATDRAIHKAGYEANR